MISHQSGDPQSSVAEMSSRASTTRSAAICAEIPSCSARLKTSTDESKIDSTAASVSASVHPASTPPSGMLAAAHLYVMPREAEDIRECGILLGVAHETRAAERGPKPRVVDGEDRVVRSVRVLGNPDFLIAGDAGRLELRELK